MRFLAMTIPGHEHVPAWGCRTAYGSFIIITKHDGEFIASYRDDVVRKVHPLGFRFRSLFLAKLACGLWVLRGCK